MKTLTRLLVATFLSVGMFLNVAQADTAKEIEQLQKELKGLKQEKEILELKAEIEALKKGEDSKESKSDLQNANVDKKGFLGFCKGESYHTGCFIGLDLEYGRASYGFNFDGTYENEGMENISGLGHSDIVGAFPLNVNFGYQWLAKNNMGVRVKGYLGYGYYNSGKMDISIYDTGNISSMNIDITAHALNYGISAAYIWNFVNGYKHTFGLYIGLGLEGMSFVSTKIKGNTSETTNQTGTTENPSYTYKANMDSAFTMTYFAGLHYIFKAHHQVSLGYKINSYGAINGNSDIDGIPSKVRITPYSSYVIGYAYKF